MSTRIGFLGGAFNPVHTDHVEIAEYVINKLQLEKVYLIPNSFPPHKNTCEISYADRRSMLELAIQDHSLLEISDIEQDSSVKHYSYETLKKLRALYGEDADLFFIMGMDSLLYLDDWYRGLELTEFASLAVVNRVDYSLTTANENIRNYLNKCAVSEDQPNFQYAAEQHRGYCLLLNKPFHLISSTALRSALMNYQHQRCSQTEEDLIEKYIDKSVLTYILDNHIYG